MLEVAGSPTVFGPVCTPCTSGTVARSPRKGSQLFLLRMWAAPSHSRAQPLAELRAGSSFIMLLGGWRNNDPHLSQACASLKPRPAAESSAHEQCLCCGSDRPGPEPVVPNPGCSLRSPGEPVGLVAGARPQTPHPTGIFKFSVNPNA